jgi:large subunit ribosomal protein L4
MAKLNVKNQKQEVVETMDVAEGVYFAKVNKGLVHQVLVAEQAAWRQGTACTKTKGEVRGGGRKPFKQKGTGNARQGSIRSPLQPGGGETFGPKPRSYTQKTPAKMVLGALRSVLSDRVKAERFLVVDKIEDGSGKTGVLAKFLKTLGVEQVLLVTEENESVKRAARNIPNVWLEKPESVTVYGCLRSEWIVVTKEAVRSLEERLGQGVA